MEAPRYTAKEIEDGLYSGMDPDVELVAAQYYDALTAERDEIQRRLDRVVEYVKPVGDQATCQCRECKQVRLDYKNILEIKEGK